MRATGLALCIRRHVHVDQVTELKRLISSNAFQSVPADDVRQRRRPSADATSRS